MLFYSSYFQEHLKHINMAKSLRSKWKRKMRKIKREKYAPKELAKLKEVLAIGKKGQPQDEEMKELVTGNA